MRDIPLFDAISKKIDYAMKHNTDTITVKLAAFNDASLLFLCQDFINVSRQLRAYVDYQNRTLKITGISELKDSVANAEPTKYTRLIADSSKHIFE